MHFNHIVLFQFTNRDSNDFNLNAWYWLLLFHGQLNIASHRLAGIKHIQWIFWKNHSTIEWHDAILNTRIFASSNLKILFDCNSMNKKNSIFLLEWNSMNVYWKFRCYLFISLMHIEHDKVIVNLINWQLNCSTCWFIKSMINGKSLTFKLSRFNDRERERVLRIRFRVNLFWNCTLSSL